MLPSGATSMEQAAPRLAMSKRTLQRRLAEEAQNCQGVPQAMCQQLAQH